MLDDHEPTSARLPGESSVTADPALLRVSVTHTEGAAVVTFRGDLDVASRAELRRTLDDMMRLKPAVVVVDLAHVGLFDCGAIGEFLHARSVLRGLGSTLVLRGLSATGVQVLDVVGLLDLVSVASGHDVEGVSDAEEPATLACEVAVLTDAWHTACETHSTSPSALVFKEPELIVTELLMAFHPDAGPFETSAGQSLPDIVTHEVPAARLAVLQLLELRRVVQAWIEWSVFPTSRHRELQRRLTEALDISVIEVVSAALAELEQAALIDPLTGLMNRRALDRDLAQFLAASRRHDRPLTVVMLDVVGLKRTNDWFGHEAGDDLLRDVTSALVGTLRVGDNVYRMGGDEFVLLLPDLRPEDVDAVMDRTVVGAGGSFTWGSAGVPTDFPGSAATPASLLKLADDRMIGHRANPERSSGSEAGSDDEMPIRRFAGESPRLVHQLQGAGRSSSVIEQAKGILAEYFHIDVETAAEMLNGFSASRVQSVRRTAYGLVDRAISAADLASAVPVGDTATQLESPTGGAERGGPVDVDIGRG